MTSIERELGNLQARMETVEGALHAMRDDVRELRDALLAARSGWRLLVLAMSLATSFGAVLDHYLPLLAGFKG
ncbi:MAG: hypothetical protein KGO53_00575 [Alphaproteobacteria bacterium]|nr:hypothetical protein [Alphaproteobacteria bacterium]